MSAVEEKAYSQGREVKDLDGKLRILQIAPPVLPIGRYGGAERVIAELDKAYTNLGLESYVVCSDDSIVRGIKLSPIKEGIWSSHRDLHQDQFDAEVENYCEKVVNFIKEIKPDIVHDHMGFVQFK